MPTSLPTKIAGQFAWAPIETWASITAGAAEYAARAAARKSTPLDVAEDLAPRAAAGLFGAVGDHGCAALVLAPQAGHASSIVDYGRGQSQMMTLRDGGLDRLFAIDWLPATEETADWSIEGYTAVLDEAAQCLGGRVNLVGDCQGGWLANIHDPDYVTRHIDFTNWFE